MNNPSDKSATASASPDALKTGELSEQELDGVTGGVGVAGAGGVKPAPGIIAKDDEAPKESVAFVRQPQRPLYATEARLNSLLPDRTCGCCNVCCVVPKIDEPALQKLPGCRCANALPSGACAIYETRPDTCRSFLCGWRLLSWVDERLRPDQSGVFIRLTKDEDLVVEPHRFALMITVVDREGLDASGLVETILTAINAHIGTWLVVPGPPGYTSCRGWLNDVLGAAATRQDAAQLKSLLEQQYAAGLAKLNETRPVVLTTLPVARPLASPGPTP